MDWFKLVGSGLWLLGLAVLLATFSLAAALRPADPRRGDRTWHDLLSNKWIYFAGMLFTAGQALSSPSPVGAAFWIALGLVVLFLAVRSRSADTTTAATPEEHTGDPLASEARPRRPTRIETLAEWLVRAELPLLALAAPLFLFPSAERIFILLVLPLLWLVRRVARGYFVPRTPLDGPLLLLLVMVLISVFATYDLNISLGKISGVLFGLAVYYALVDWGTSTGRIGWSVAGYLIVGLGLTVVGLVGLPTVEELAARTPPTARLRELLIGLPGAHSAGLQPNEVAGYLLWVAPLSLALVGSSLRLRSGGSTAHLARGLALVLLAAVSLGTLLLTQSRGAYAGLLAAVVLLLWLAAPRVRVFMFAAAVVAVLVLIFIGPTQAGEMLEAALGRNASISGGIDTLEGRTEIWLRAVYAIQDFALTGTGMNVFRDLLGVLYPVYSVRPQMDLAHAHNHLLQAALDLGLAGLVAYIAIWLVAGTLVVQAWRAAVDPFVRGLAAGIGACLLAYFTYGLTDTVTLGAKPGFVFWALLGLLVIVWQRALAKPAFAAPAQQPGTAHAPG